MGGLNGCDVVLCHLPCGGQISHEQHNAGPLAATMAREGSLSRQVLRTNQVTKYSTVTVTYSVLQSSPSFTDVKVELCGF
jgi:hypothetical protein